jgi:hypothetical protein
MFPHSYFVAGHFSPAYFPPVVVNGGGVQLVLEVTDAFAATRVISVGIVRTVIID